MHAVAHTRILSQYNKTCQKNNQSICRIRQHQTEEKHIEKRHDRRRVNLTFFRKTIGFQNPLHRLRKGIIAQKHRSFLFLPYLFHIKDQIIALFHCLLHCGNRFFRYISADKKGPGGLWNMSQEFVFLCSGSEIVRYQTQVCALVSIFSNMLLTILNFFLECTDFFLQIFFFDRRNFSHDLRWPSKTALPQRILHLLCILLQNTTI